jgi:hypothetical protein
VHVDLVVVAAEMAIDTVHFHFGSEQNGVAEGDGDFGVAVVAETHGLFVLES